MTDANSIQAYREICADGTVKGMRLEVLRVLNDRHPLCAREIADMNGRNPNDTAARLRELEQLNVVYRVRSDVSPASGKNVWFWAMTGNQPSGSIRKATSKTEQLVQLCSEVADWLDEKNGEAAARIRERVAIIMKLERGAEK